MRLACCLFFCIAFALAGCATPRIVVLSDPLDAREHNDLGASYEASGELDLALTAYETAAAKDRTWDQPLINLGNVQAALGDWAQAEARYRQALKRNPQNPEAMNNLAFALINLGQAQEALDWSAKALEVESGNALFKSTRALALSRLGEKSRALALLDEVLQGLPGADPLREKIIGLRDQIANAAP
ncbi:MAG: hypothetical protein CVU60_07785 [Deltaproteobacteria bacterium HGW-Deltaproteobacteria-18]|jgi:tetratricopeptide (TPR) repeat protein|nr:MAG: hypothetical protein CVU60_07785 [Deltaproteobacteria bacterium HGW-Deltaproteobacteria-18]